MATRQHPAPAKKTSRKPQTKQQTRSEKQHVKRQERPSLTPSIAEATIIKDGDIFFLAEPNGRVPLNRPHGLGLYYHDTRFLNGYELKVAGIDWDVLSASAARCLESMFQLSNPPLHTKNGHFIQKEELGLKWERVANDRQQALNDMITIQNFSDVPVEVPMTATFETNFEPIFEVRGLHGKHLGHTQPPTWKDDALVFIYDGADKIYRSLTVSFAPPPIALVEVQGYAYMAKREIADLFERAGATGRATELRKQADELKRQFNQAFWSKDLDCFVLALQDNNRPCEVVSSNPGQALWTGIVDRNKAKAICDALMSDATFSGWGVRTLAATAKPYNPIGYHVGAVWPHDNSLIAAGLRRYGFDDAFHRIFRGIADATGYFRLYRLPEVFCGFDQETYRMPVHYPIACHPQAWAAGAIPFLLTECLGLQPAAFAQQLHVVRPNCRRAWRISNCTGSRSAKRGLISTSPAARTTRSRSMSSTRLASSTWSSRIEEGNSSST